jgi:hypothetical protein
MKCGSPPRWSADSRGYQHGLEYVFNPESYLRYPSGGSRDSQADVRWSPSVITGSRGRSSLQAEGGSQPG